MNKNQAYGIIAKHIFLASLRYSTDFNPIIILADNMEDAKEKARNYLGVEGNVWQPHITGDADIFKV